MAWALRSLCGPLLSAHLLTTSKLAVVWPAAIVRPPGAALPGCPLLPVYTSRHQWRLVHRTQPRRSPGAWGLRPPTSCTGYIPGHCLPLLPHQPHSINYSALSLPQFERQAHLGAYPAHWQFSKESQNLPACHHSQSLSNECGQFPQSRSRHLEICPSYCEGCELFFQPHYCRIAPPHPAFSTDSV